MLVTPSKLLNNQQAQIDVKEISEILFNFYNTLKVMRNIEVFQLNGNYFFKDYFDVCVIHAYEL